MIEPSFGVGRIIYCMLEHCYYTREGDDKRAVFGLAPLIAPIKVRCRCSQHGMVREQSCLGCCLGPSELGVCRLCMPFSLSTGSSELCLCLRPRLATGELNRGHCFAAHQSCI